MAEVTVTDSRETDALLSEDGFALQQSTSSEPVNPRTRCSWPWLLVVILAMLAGAVSCVGENLLAAPRIRLFESVLCLRYYEEHDPSVLPNRGVIPEHLCKVDPVQDELAIVMGGQLFFDSIPAIVLAIPFSLLADKYGRKWILVASSISYTFSYIWAFIAIGTFNLPLQWVWLSSAFFLLGGGPTVATYLITTVVADVAPPASRSVPSGGARNNTSPSGTGSHENPLTPERRTTVFFYRYCTDLIADLTIPPLTSYLMSRDIWLSLFGAAISQALSSLICCALPETAPTPRTPAVEDQPSDFEGTERLAVGSSHSLNDCDSQSLARTEKSAFAFLAVDGVSAALIFTFMISKIGRQSSNVLLQYVSKRYDWSLAQAGLLVSLRASVNILLYIVILPALAAYILRRIGVSTVRDLLLARGSALLLLFGTIVLAFSVTPALMIIGVILFTLGTGFPHAARGLMTSLVESASTDKTKSQIARLYALVSVAEGIGSLIGALSLAWTFRIGLNLGREWLGLPFGLIAVFFSLVALVVFSISTKYVS